MNNHPSHATPPVPADLLPAILESLPHPVALISAEGIIECANARATRMGMNPGLHVDQLVHPEIKSLLAEALTSARPLASPPDSPLRWIEDGREACFLPSASPLFDPAGNIQALLLILTDSSSPLPPSKSPEDPRKRLMSSFSHQLKTPLTSIQMAIYLLLEDAAPQLTPRQLELLTAARDDVDRLHQSVEDLLAKARQTP